MKNSRVHFLILLFSLFNLYVSSQSLAVDYTPIKSQGNIPEDFIMNTQKKVAADIDLIDAQSRGENKLRENYTYHANYAIDKQLHGGNILLNEKLSAYINKIVDELLKKDPALRNELKVFVTKVPEMNAYCMGKGYLFVNLGLIAKVNNEAQLAYVLAHEISHYVKKHNFNTYSEYKKIDKEYKKKTFEDRQVQKLTFSKENETEADTYGYELYSRSGYSSSEVIPAFDILKYSYLPFEELPFDTTFFNDRNYKIPAEYFLGKVLSLKDDEGYDDSKSTHPNIRKRKESIEKMMKDQKTDPGKKKFLVSENEFFEVRDISRFELCRLYLIERSYLHSMFSAYILLKKYPDNIYLYKIISKSLFAMVLYKNGDLKYNYDSYRHGPIPDFTKTEGYSQQLNFMLDRIPQKEMTILTLKYVWKCHQKFPNEPFYVSLSDSLMEILTKKFHSGINEYYSDDNSRLDGGEYYKYAFVDYLQKDAEFKKKFNDYSTTIAGQGSSGLKAYVPPVKKDKKEKEKIVTGPRYNIKKIIVVDPSYFRYDETLSETSIYAATDKRQENLIAAINANAAQKGISVTMIDPGRFTSDKMFLYNDFSLINDWFNERMEGDEEQTCPSLNSDEIPALIKRYETRYILWPSVVSVRQKISGSIKHEDFTYYYSVLFDLETGKIVSKKALFSEKNDGSFRINDYVDDTFDAIVKLNGN